MKVSELLEKAKEIWLLARQSISIHQALREATPFPNSEKSRKLRSDAHMYLGRAMWTEEEHITRATALAAIDEAGLGPLFRGEEPEGVVVERDSEGKIVDPPEGPETW